MAVKPGDILRDKFRIDALIGRGGMGQVFAATALDSTSREQVAIKVVSRLLVDDILMVRLHREAEAATRIRSEFVPRVLEVSDTDEGETFLVMERLVGEPLSQRIRDNGALPWSEVAKIGEDVLRALIDAHTAGIVHRDLKPSNVFLALKSGKVRAMVLDFGVCKMDGVDAERLTGTGESIGTVAYMAPEQIRGAARVDERADLFAFGVVVFEMLCGRLPHEGPSQMAILASKLENLPARLRDCTRVAIPAGLDELVWRALARDPAQRFANAQDLLKAWRGLVKSSSMFPVGGSVPPPRLSAPDSERTAGGDAPTEVLGAAKVTPTPGAPSSESMADTDEDLAPAARPSFAPRDEQNTEVDPDESESGRNFNLASSPPGAYGAFPQQEPHPTQTSLTTHHTGIIRPGGRGARLALIGAAASLAIGVVVVGVSFSRPDSSSNPSAASSASEAASAEMNSSSSSSSTVATPEVSTPPAADSSEATSSFELPDNPPDSPPVAPGTTKHPAARPIIHKRPPHPASKPATSKGITNQPRY